MYCTFRSPLVSTVRGYRAARQAVGETLKEGLRAALWLRPVTELRRLRPPCAKVLPPG